MSNPSKQKGTGYETELVRELAELGLRFKRTENGETYDLSNATLSRFELEPLEVLATRPDRGQTLVTMRLKDFAHLLSLTAQAPSGPPTPPWETHIEAKRYARLAHHSIFEKKFGRKR